MSDAKFYGVSVGPGDPELVTIKAVRVMEQCFTIAAVQTKSGANVALDVARAAAKLDDKKILYLSFAMSTDPEVLEKSHRVAAEQVLEELKAGRSVAMPNIGDASIYSTFAYIKEIVEEAGYECPVIPGVPSFCAIAATLGETLTPRMDTPLHIIPSGFEDLDEALDMDGTKVIMKAGKSLGDIKELLRKKRLYEKASLVENCGLPNERVAHNLDDIDGHGAYFTTLIVKQ